MCDAVILIATPILIVVYLVDVFGQYEKRCPYCGVDRLCKGTHT